MIHDQGMATNGSSDAQRRIYGSVRVVAGTLKSETGNWVRGGREVVSIERLNRPSNCAEGKVRGSPKVTTSGDVILVFARTMLRLYYLLQHLHEFARWSPRVRSSS